MRLVSEAYIGYTGRDNMTFNVPVQLLKKSINPKNINKLPYIRKVANAFSYMLSLHVYFTDRNDYTNLDQTQIIISDDQLADAIGCHPNTSTRVMNTLKEIFGLEYTRIHEQGGARIVNINERVIEFLKIYSYNELFDYINKYDLRDSKNSKALQQLYKYRIWGVKSKYLRPSQQEHRSEFLKKSNDFFHQVATNNMSDEARIQLVRENKDKISEFNTKQLDRIIQEKKKGKLHKYCFTLLVKLYQKVTRAIANALRLKKQQETEALNSSRIDNESRPGETVAHASATQNAQRIPEDPEVTPNDILEVGVEWNNMLGSSTIPNIKLNQNEINLINTYVKSIGKRELISCIRKVQGLKKVSSGEYKMTFKKFMTDKTLDIIMNSGLQEDAPMGGWFQEYMDEQNGTISVPFIELESVPQFVSINDVTLWWS